MTKFLFLILVVNFVTVMVARAERWVIKNPHAALTHVQAVKQFELGGERYLVVNTPPFASALAELRTAGETAFRDAEIGLPPVVEEQDWEEWMREWRRRNESRDEEQTAWHVKSLQYDKLPAQYDGKGIVVAVVDTGVDYTHVALKDRIWVNPGEIAGNGIDDDRNGYVDDIHGWDFEKNKSDPMDVHSHGTHCAGVISSEPQPQTKAQGVAPGAKIMAIRIIGEKQVGFLSDAVTGIKYAVDNGARVLSNSWRIYRSWSDYDTSDANIEMLRLAVEYAGNHGAIFVAAAGNESVDMDSNFDQDPVFPVGYKNMLNLITVAASDKNDEPAYFTNFGTGYVTVAAPGVGIVSTVPGNSWSAMSGTSMATPLVAGALARGLSANYAAVNSIDRLVSTSTLRPSWDKKVRARGVVHFLNYLAH